MFRVTVPCPVFRDPVPCYCSMVLLCCYSVILFRVIVPCYCSHGIYKIRYPNTVVCYCFMLLLRVTVPCCCSVLLFHVAAPCYCSMLLRRVTVQCFSFMFVVIDTFPLSLYCSVIPFRVILRRTLMGNAR